MLHVVQSGGQEGILQDLHNIAVNIMYISLWVHYCMTVNYQLQNVGSSVALGGYTTGVAEAYSHKPRESIKTVVACTS